MLFATKILTNDRKSPKFYEYVYLIIYNLKFNYVII